MADDHRNQPKAEHIEWFLTFAFGNRIALTVDSVNIRATCASGCSHVRLIPVVGDTTGAHYRMSTGHSSPALAHEVLISLRSNDYFAGTPNELQK